MNVKQLIASADLMRAIQSKRDVVVVTDGKVTRVGLRQLTTRTGAAIGDGAPVAEAFAEVFDYSDGRLATLELCPLLDQLAEGSALVLPE